MALTKGQRIALDQLQRIAESDESPVQIVGIEESPLADACLKIRIVIDCRRYPRVKGGLPLHDREGVTLSVPTDFPFRPPSADTIHTRFHGFNHVQWGTHLCIYLSTEIQWVPSHGMYGFLVQLAEWFRRGARNELDHPEGPMHPPVAYVGSSKSICVNVDPPGRRAWPWLGFALLRQPNRTLLEVYEWLALDAISDHTQFAPTVLLDFTLPFEYPDTVRSLFDYLENRGKLGYRLLAHMMIASERISDGLSMFIGVGAPSRGIAGDTTQRNQHLAFWEIGAADVAVLREASIACRFRNYYKRQDTSERIQALVDTIFARLVAWRQDARVRWCRVIENRPEIITRRDKDTPMNWFHDKRVALWGCGAVGGAIAEHLVRAGVSQITLYDRSGVTPGLLVRQNFSASDVNKAKSIALAQRLYSVAPNTQAIPRVEDIVSCTLARPDWDAGVDLIIDTTASLHVRSKLEAVLKEHKRTVPVSSVMISATAREAISVFAPVAYGAGMLDVLRRLGIATATRDWLTDWSNAFWAPEGLERLRQPEPGCSDPTFAASHADVSALSAKALNVLAESAADSTDAAHGFLISRLLEQRDHRFQFKPDIRWVADGVDIRVSQSAWRDVMGWIHSNARERSTAHETGGLLFGDIDDTLGIAWITNVSGPPRDSTYSANGFICGTHGTKKMSEDYRARTHNIVRYVGTWHSHPVSAAKPSATDYMGITDIFATAPDCGIRQMMAIIGHSAQARPQLGVYIFEKHKMATHGVETGQNSLLVRGGITVPPSITSLNKNIGLSLSGGGSRAIAFHLGTLRALEDLKILDEIDVVSGVSGGAVTTGMFGYSDVPFTKFDRDTVRLLRRGFVIPSLTKLVHPIRAAALVVNGIVIALPALLIDSLTFLTNCLASCFPRLRNLFAFNVVSRCAWPFRRRYSRTHLLAEAVADVVGPQYCSAPTRQGKSIVFNACELRTGTAFRMSNQRFGSYRFGWAPADEMRVADAITASAAYPSLLPPFDWEKSFKRSGTTDIRRVIVTDGGVFENLGVTVMEPGRNPKVSRINYDVDVIIVSDAGVGQFTGDDTPTSLLKRMPQAVRAVMRKVQDATKKRLHVHVKSGRIDGFVYVALGQIDQRVPLKPANWVDRKWVTRYPTDFSSMTEANIQKISDRGEAITRALVTQYLLTD